MAINELIASAAQKGAKLMNGEFGQMCNDCAFKLNSDANLEDFTVDAAVNCLLSNGATKFNCHIEAGVPKECECIGFKYATAFWDSIDNKTK